MTSKAWHDRNLEFVPVEFGYNLDETVGVGLCAEDAELNIKKFAVFMTREEAIKLRSQLDTYINNAVRREDFMHV